MRGWWLALALCPLAARGQDVEAGKDVYGPCAACHGANGEGGKGGEYPRLAGQPPGYLVSQLELFQGRKRANLPMFPYTEPRELSAADMKDVAAFLTRLDLPAKAPQFKDSDRALDRLLAMEKVLVVPHVEGDVEHGRAVFKKRCASCHGRQGRGKKRFPRLLGQYPNYLQRQVDAFLRGDRPHDDEEAGQGVLTRVTAKDVADVLAFLTAIQDQDPEPEDANGDSRGR